MLFILAIILCHLYETVKQLLVCYFVDRIHFIISVSTFFFIIRHRRYVQILDKRGSVWYYLLKLFLWKVMPLTLCSVSTYHKVNLFWRFTWGSFFCWLRSLNLFKLENFTVLCSYEPWLKISSFYQICYFYIFYY